MAYHDRTHQTYDPYTQHLHGTALGAPRSGGGTLAGLAVAVGIILAAIFGTSFLGGNPDAAATPPADATAPASDAADAPLAPAPTESGSAGAPL